MAVDTVRLTANRLMRMAEGKRKKSGSKIQMESSSSPRPAPEPETAHGKSQVTRSSVSYASFDENHHASESIQSSCRTIRSVFVKQVHPLDLSESPSLFDIQYVIESQRPQDQK